MNQSQLDPTLQPLDPLVLAAIIAGALLLLVGLFIWWRGRPFVGGEVFRASRLSSGNRLFPTQVQITQASVVHYTPQWFGHREQSIHIAHVSSVSIDTNLMFSDVLIETSGGASPVRCHGHRKRDAVRMKQLIEQYQSGYYRKGPEGVQPPLENRSPAADK